MGISEFILKKKAMKPIKQRQKIRLKKPIVNLFIGDFKAKEHEALISLLDDRVGLGCRINYVRISFTNSGGENERIMSLPIEGVAVPGAYEPKERENFQQEVSQKMDKLRNLAADYVNDIFNEVSTVSYPEKARIRLNVFVKPETMEAASLPYILPVLKEEFAVYFPNGVHVDAYVIMDQRGYKREERGDERKIFTYLSLNEIESLAVDKMIQMPIAMSNYVSGDYLDLECDEERMITSGLMMIIKDGMAASSSLVGEDKIDEYTDYSFIEDCKNNSGHWYSLGHFKLDVAEDLVDYIAYRALMVQMQKTTENLSAKTKLSQMELTEDQIDQFCGNLIPMSSFPSQIFYSMVKNSNANVASMVNNPRRAVIHSIYGDNLDLLYKLNCTNQYQRILEEQMVIRSKKIQKILTAMYEEEGYTLADMNAATNYILQHLEAIQEQCEIKKEAQHHSMDEWLEEVAGIANLRDIVKDTGEPKAFYQLASQYLDHKVLNLHIEIKLSVVQAYIETVMMIAKQYSALAVSVEGAIGELSEDINLMLEDELKIRSGNIEEFYSDLVTKVLEEDGKFASFVRKVNSKVCAGELEGEELFEQMITYCDDNILTDERFEKDFAVEMLKRLKNFEKFNNEEAIYDFAFETIMDNKKFYANYDTFSKVNSEVCFLVNPNNKFVTGTNKRMQTLKTNRQLKVFFEEHFNDMDVLFMEGCFELESMYNFKVYKNVYEKMKTSGGNNG